MSIPNLDTKEIRRNFIQGKYKKASYDLLQLIRKNRKELLLDYCLFTNNFVQSILNTYRYKNHAVIRTPSQLLGKVKELEAKNKIPEAKILLALVNKIKQNGISLLLADDLSNKKKLFQEISHELNAWTASGCSDKKKNFSCLLDDWRRFIPRKLSRQLDYYFWGLSDSI